MKKASLIIFDYLISIIFSYFILSKNHNAPLILYWLIPFFYLPFSLLVFSLISIIINKNENHFLFALEIYAAMITFCLIIFFTKFLLL